jgi:hypothetical protein
MPSTPDKITATPIFLVDGLTDNCSVIAFANGQNDNPEYQIILDRDYPVDRITIANGNPGREGIYPVRDMTGSVFSLQNPTNAVMRGNLTLSNGPGFQEFRFDKPVSGKVWKFRPESLYEPQPAGRPVSLAALAEIEFWYRGDKYTVVNIPEVVSNALEAVRQTRLQQVRIISSTVRNASVFTDIQSVFSRLRERGVPVERIEMNEKRNRPTELHIQITETNMTDGGRDVIGGRIQAGRKQGLLTVTKDVKTGQKIYRFADPVEIGEWRMSERGEIFIRAGNGAWLLETGPVFSFEGTELAGIYLRQATEFK